MTLMRGVRVPTISNPVCTGILILQPIIGWADERAQDRPDWDMVEGAVNQQHSKWLIQHPKEMVRRRLEEK